MVDHVYACFGLHVRSQIPLPEIHDSPAPDGILPRVVVRLADNAERGEDERIEASSFEASDRGVSFSIAGVARYRVTNGCEIVVDPEPKASVRDVRLFLLGSAFGILCHQRGLAPLHANAIVVRGNAVAFAGSTGAGKSTLAAYFQKCGRQLLCDDVCVVSFDENGRPLAWPGPPRLKLWRDAACSFGHDSAQLERVVDGRDKFHIPFSRSIGNTPFPLRRVYLLETSETESETRFHRLRGAEAVEAVAAQTYRSNLLGRMGLRSRLLQQSAALATRAEIYRVSRHWGFRVFEREADRILRHAEEGQSGFTPSSDLS